MLDIKHAHFARISDNTPFFAADYSDVALLQNALSSCDKGIDQLVSVHKYSYGREPS